MPTPSSSAFTQNKRLSAAAMSSASNASAGISAKGGGGFVNIPSATGTPVALSSNNIKQAKAAASASAELNTNTTKYGARGSYSFIAPPGVNRVTINISWFADLQQGDMINDSTFCTVVNFAVVPGTVYPVVLDGVKSTFGIPNLYHVTVYSNNVVKNTFATSGAYFTANRVMKRGTYEEGVQVIWQSSVRYSDPNLFNQGEARLFTNVFSGTTTASTNALRVPRRVKSIIVAAVGSGGGLPTNPGDWGSYQGEYSGGGGGCAWAVNFETAPYNWDIPYKAGRRYTTGGRNTDPPHGESYVGDMGGQRPAIKAFPGCNSDRNSLVGNDHFGRGGDYAIYQPSKLVYGGGSGGMGYGPFSHNVHSHGGYSGGGGGAGGFFGNGGKSSQPIASSWHMTYDPTDGSGGGGSGAVRNHVGGGNCLDFLSLNNGISHQGSGNGNHGSSGSINRTPFGGGVGYSGDPRGYPPTNEASDGRQPGGILIAWYDTSFFVVTPMPLYRNIVSLSAPRPGFLYAMTKDDTSWNFISILSTYGQNDYTGAVNTVNRFFIQDISRPGHRDGDISQILFGANVPRFSVDEPGDAVYLTDNQNDAIRKYTLSTRIISTIAGGVDEEGRDMDLRFDEARYNSPFGISRNPKTGILYIADAGNNVIRSFDERNKTVSTVAGNAAGAFADGGSTVASFNTPSACVVDLQGTFLYVADTLNYVIRKVNLADGSTTTVCGRPGIYDREDGPFATALFGTPTAITINSSGNLFVVDGNMIREINFSDSTVSTLPNIPDEYTTVDSHNNVPVLYGIACDSSDFIYVALSMEGGSSIGRGSVLRYDGSRWMPISITMNMPYRGIVGDTLLSPKAICYDPSFNVLYVSDSGMIRYICLTDLKLYTLAGRTRNFGYGDTDGVFESVFSRAISGMAVAENSDLYVSDTDNDSIRKIRNPIT